MIKNCMKKSVVSIKSDATIKEAASLMVKYHVGILPVVNSEQKLLGMLAMQDLLALELPSFFNLIGDLDFVSDFGAVETEKPTLEQISQPVTTLMQPVKAISEESGLVFAYGLMVKHDLSDLPVTDESNTLVGIVSRVDIGTIILSDWEKIGEDHP